MRFLSSRITAGWGKHLMSKGVTAIHRGCFYPCFRRSHSLPGEELLIGLWGRLLEKELCHGSLSPFVTGELFDA